jgi:protein SCO1/2
LAKRLTAAANHAEVGRDANMAKKKVSKSAEGVSKKALVVTLAIGVLLGAASVAVLLNSSATVERRTGRQVLDFTGLVDTTGFVLKAGDLRDAPQLVFFGFTQCPDVCPATLSTVAAALRRLPVEVADQVRPVLITVDPKTDNAQVLARYVAGFDARIHGLTGDPALLQKIADSYGAVVGREKATDHTSLLYLVSADGEVLRTFLPGAPPQEIAVAIEMAVRG